MAAAKKVAADLDGVPGVAVLAAFQAYGIAVADALELHAPVVSQVGVVRVADAPVVSRVGVVRVADAPVVSRVGVARGGDIPVVFQVDVGPVDFAKAAFPVADTPVIGVPAPRGWAFLALADSQASYTMVAGMVAHGVCRFVRILPAIVDTIVLFRRILLIGD